MFICAKCLEACQGPPIEYAKTMVTGGFGSRGLCEFCGKTAVCADVPSSAPWSRKPKELRS